MEIDTQEINKSTNLNLESQSNLSDYKSLMNSYNLMSQALSRHAELTHSSHLLNQNQELRTENERVKQENLQLQHMVHKLLIENSQLKEHTQAKSEFTEIDINKIPLKAFNPNSELSQSHHEDQNSEIAALKKQVLDLSVYRTKSLEINQKNSELDEELGKLKTNRELLHDEINKLTEKLKKSEESLEITKLHRDLLQNKILKIKAFKNEFKITEADLKPIENDRILIEKRLSILEDRLRGTEEIEKYVKKYNEALNHLQTSKSQIKHLQALLDDSSSKISQLTHHLSQEQQKCEKLFQENSQKLFQTPQILKRLVFLLHKQNSNPHKSN